MYGWKGNILRVDLTKKKISKEKISKYVKKYLGGRGIAAKIAWEEIPNAIDASHAENRLLIMTGPLTGTLAPTSGRTVICAISPRVYPQPWYTHSTMGGFFGPFLKYAGYDGIVISGISNNLCYILIDDGNVEIKNANDIWGLGTRATQKFLKTLYGEESQIICIGPAGERKVRLAAICHSKENASGLSGFGAVMGSKNLKAIVVRGTSTIKIADPRKFIQVCKRSMEISRGGTVDNYIRRRFIKENVRPICSQACSVNCLLGNLYKNVPLKQPMGYIESEVLFCTGNIWVSGMEDTAYASDKITVPPGKSFGVRDGIEMHALCDDLGLDLSLLMLIQPWLIACVNSGVDSLVDTKLNPEDKEWFKTLLIDIAYRRTKLGDLLAEGLNRALDTLKGKVSEQLNRLGRALEFGFGFPAHREGRIWDPEPDPYWIVSAIMYATESRDPAIGTHTAYLHLANIYLDDPTKNIEKLRELAKKVWGTEKAVERGYEYKPEVAIWCQHQHILLDSLPLCDFAFPRIMKSITTDEEWIKSEDLYGDLSLESELITYCTGITFSYSDLEKIAERIFNLERIILVKKFGRNKAIDESISTHFELPCRTDNTKIGKDDFRMLLERYYKLRGWDPETGMPTDEKLKSLDLHIDG